MKRKIWGHVAHSFKEAEDFDNKYYLSMTPEERISTVQFCREIYHGKIKHEGKRRFQRVFKVIEQKRPLDKWTGAV